MSKDYKNAAEALADITGRPKEDFIPEDMRIPDFEDQEIKDG